MSSPANTFCGPRTFSAWPAAQDRWSIARPTSSCASAWGLPVSWCTTSARAHPPREYALPLVEHPLASVEPELTPPGGGLPGTRDRCVDLGGPVDRVDPDDVARGRVQRLQLLAHPLAFDAAQQVRCLLADHDRGGVGVAPGYDGHDGRVGHAQPLDAVHPSCGSTTACSPNPIAHVPTGW